MAAKYCTECGKEKRVAIFMNDPWCSENCRKSMKKEGPTVVSDLSLEAFPKRSIDEIAKDIP